MAPTATNVFGKWLSPEEYHEWVVLNGYSKPVLLEGQAGEKQSTNDRKVYQLNAWADYNDPIHRRPNTRTSVFFARAKLNPENWPLFQHFVCLLTDPFVCIHRIVLTSQNKVLNLLDGSINPNHARIQCRELIFNLGSNAQKCVSWVKDHVFCNDFNICNNRSHDNGCNYDKELVDLLVAGATCASVIMLIDFDLSNVLVDLVQKFFHFKNCDENQMAEFIQGQVTGRRLLGVLKRNFASFILKEERNNYIAWTIIFQFVNNDLGKKLNLYVTTPSRYATSYFSLKINNL